MSKQPIQRRERARRERVGKGKKRKNLGVLRVKRGNARGKKGKEFFGEAHD